MFIINVLYSFDPVWNWLLKAFLFKYKIYIIYILIITGVTSDFFKIILSFLVMYLIFIAVNTEKRIWRRLCRFFIRDFLSVLRFWRTLDFVCLYLFLRKTG